MQPLSLISGHSMIVLYTVHHLYIAIATSRGFPAELGAVFRALPEIPEKMRLSYSKYHLR